MRRNRRHLAVFIATLVLCATGFSGTALAGHDEANRREIARLGVDKTPSLRFAVGGGSYMRVASQAYDRVQISPMVALLDALPHGDELAKLNLYVATDAEISQTCGASTMACYDPGAERMIVSGESEEVAGVPREAVIAHEYGHHIANNRRGGIWSALEAGTERWSTYEGVCELARGGQAFPGDQGSHYWENPGEAFAQAYSQMVIPQDGWHYSSLLQPDAIALEKLRQDVLRPWPEPRKRIWRGGWRGENGARLGLDNAVAASGASFRRTIAVPVDGRLSVRLRSKDGGRYRLSLVDPVSGAILARSLPARPGSGRSRLDYADCGHRSLTLEAVAVGAPGSFEAAIVVP